MVQDIRWFSVLMFILWSAPAEARSKPSACVAPTQAITSEEQKEVAATVTAQAQKVASGEASATGTTARTYATVLIDKGDVARLFAVYQWCVQREQGLISNEFYEKMVGQLQGASSTLAVTPVPVPSGDRPSSSSTASGPASPMAETMTIGSVAGVWKVTTVETPITSCAGGRGSPGSITSYIWLISVNQNIATVAVQGTTSFPNLSGTVDQAQLTLTLEGSADFALQKNTGGTFDEQYYYRAATSWFTAKLVDGVLVGTRRVLLFEDVELSTGDIGVRACFIDYDLKAVR